MKKGNIEYDSEKITFKDDINSQSSFIILIAIFIILFSSTYIPKDNVFIDILFYTYSVIALLFIIIHYTKLDFSKEIKLEDIKNIKLKYNITGNITLKFYNTKGKYRFFNSLNNREEAQEFVSYAQAEKLKIDIIDKRIK